MLVSFDSLPDNARIWIYQVERSLNPSEQQVVLEIGEKFIAQWASHGQPLTGSLKILNEQFVVIAVDDSQLPSGCSIDASVALVRDLGSKLNLDFFGRTNIPLWLEDKVHLVPLTDLKTGIKNGTVADDTQLLNTLIQHKGGLADWIVPIRNSWLARYLPQPQDS